MATSTKIILQMVDGRSYTRGNIGNHIYATGTHSVVFANGRDASMHSWKQ